MAAQHGVFLGKALEVVAVKPAYWSADTSWKVSECCAHVQEANRYIRHGTASSRL